MGENKGTYNTKAMLWLALACLVVPMFASYFFDDIFSTLSHIFKNPQFLELGWDAAAYGVYAGGYSFLCVCGGLVIGGILLDMFGVRKVGSVFVGIMILGALTVFFAITSGLNPRTSLTIAYIGCMFFGLGSEIAGVAVTRSIAKWFKGRNVALAMGLQLAIARLGCAAAFILAPVLCAEKPYGEIYTLSETARPAFVGLCLLLVGGILWTFFVALDGLRDSEMGLTETGEKKAVEGNVDETMKRGQVKDEDKFRFSDILKVLTNPRFLMLALLCVFFYCCIITFKKFGTSIVIPRFDMDVETAKWMITMIPFFTIVFTPLFGTLVDKVGKATTWMLVGSVLVLAAHLVIGFAPSGVPVYGYVGISMLGIGYSLVPSAMWPSVPKIIPEKNLGTAYSLIYWIQNIGMLTVPIFIGRIFRAEAVQNVAATGGEPTAAAETAHKMTAAVNAELIFIGLGIVAVCIALALLFSSRKHKELGLDLPAGK